MTDQAEGQSPSIKEQIGALLSPPEPEQVQEAPAEGEVEAQQTTETPQEAPQEPDPTANWEEVEVNGVRVVVPPEVAKSVMQERDYTQKTQTLADEKRVLAAREQAIQLQQQALQHIQPLLARGQAIDQQIQQFQRLDWRALQESDPLSYASKRADYAALMQEQQQTFQQFQQAQQHFGQQRQRAMAQAAQAAMPVLKKAIPDWGPERDAQLTKYALGSGAAPEELMGLASRPWAVIALEKARKYDELQATKAQLPKRVQGLSPVAKPGARPIQSGQDASYRKAIEQVQKSGGKDKGALRAAIKAKLGT